MIRRILFARRIAHLKQEREWTAQAIERARKGRVAVSHLYTKQQAITRELMRLGA